MKKTKALFAVALAGVCALSCLSGCGETIQEIDTNKTQLYVSLYNGGAGTDWFNNMASEWNAQNDKYEIIPQNEKKEPSTVAQEVSLGQTATSPSIYFSIGSTNYKSLIEQDKLEDLTPLLQMKPDGESGMTIREKLNAKEGFFDLWNDLAANSKTGGTYMIPWNESISGFVYDHDYFLNPNEVEEKNNGLEPDYTDTFYFTAGEEDKAALKTQGIQYTEEGRYLYFVSSDEPVNYEAGDLILTAGRDDKFGTYDDGQPDTIEEWDIMIDKILLSGARTFIWVKQFQTGYMEFIYNSIMAQYAGTQSVIDFYDKDSGGREYEMHDGTSASFTIDDGYKSFNMESIYQAIKFNENYFTNTQEIHPRATESSYDHGDIQSLFLLGYKSAESGTPYAAMLCEGSWWENEARVAFATNEQDDPARGYGKREYRYMLTPNLDGAVGAFGDGTGTALCISEQSSIIVPKCADAEKKAAIFDFLAFTLSEENLRMFTRTTGILRPYSYTLTDEDFAQMTPFGRNLWTIYNDTENISFIRYGLFSSQPISYATDGYNSMPIEANDVSYGSILAALERAGVDDIMEGISSYYTESSWADFVAQAREAGFYN